jgi:hypothetical protein
LLREERILQLDARQNGAGGAAHFRMRIAARQPAKVRQRRRGIETEQLAHHMPADEEMGIVEG